MATVSEVDRTAPSAPAAPAAGWAPPNPGALGLAGFGITTFVLSMINANLVGSQSTTAVLGLALAFGGGAQLLAGMWEFRNQNVFGATVHSAYGAFWISYYVLVHEDLAGLTKSGGAAGGIGLYLWAWAIFTAMMLVCTFNLPRVVTAIFGFLLATFILLAIGAAGGSADATHIGGYLGIVTAVLALYGCTAIVSAETYGRQVLPMG